MSIADLPIANIEPGPRQWPETEFVNVSGVPIFIEHETATKRKGDQEAKPRILRFGRRELQAITNNCNRRIEETGDCPALAIGHTSDPKDGPSRSSQEAPVGFADNFRVGVMPGTGKYAILCDWHIYRDDYPRVKKYRRRSPELWLAEDYAEMFFDPISLLGVEAPRLDMGMLNYSRRRAPDGREVQTYSAVCASPTNVFVPTTDDRDRREYAAEPEETIFVQEEETDPMVDQELVQEVVSALMQTPQMQFVKQMMDEKAASNPEPTSVAPPAEPAPEAPAAPPVEPEDGETAKYSRVLSELERMSNEHKALREQLTEERGRRVETERYSALEGLRRRKQFDLAAEKEVCRYAKMNDEQFAEHFKRIEANYRDLPVDTVVPSPEFLRQPSKENYSKDEVDKAIDICTRARCRGENPDYLSTLEQVHAGKL